MKEKRDGSIKENIYTFWIVSSLENDLWVVINFLIFFIKKNFKKLANKKYKPNSM